MVIHFVSERIKSGYKVELQSKSTPPDDDDINTFIWEFKYLSVLENLALLKSATFSKIVLYLAGCFRSQFFTSTQSIVSRRRVYEILELTQF